MTSIDRFCDDHFTYNGICEDRQRMVRRVLAAIETDCRMAAHEIDEDDFRAWIRDQLDDGLHVNTVCKHRSAVRPFFEWAWRKGLIDDGRYMRLRMVPPPRGGGPGRPRPYSRKELDAFWRNLDARWPLEREDHWLDRFQRGLSPYRRAWPLVTRRQFDAIIRLALDCGLRRQEIFGASIDDIHPDNAYVVVREDNAKGDKYREVPYTTASREAIARWLATREMLMAKFGTSHDSVWLAVHPSATPNGRLPSSPAAPMRDRAFEMQLHSLGYEFHRLRHTCATERLRAGMPLEVLQRFLGHASLQQTLAYADIVRDDIHRAALRTEGAFERAVGQAA